MYKQVLRRKIFSTKFNINLIKKMNNSGSEWMLKAFLKHVNWTKLNLVMNGWVMYQF